MGFGLDYIKLVRQEERLDGFANVRGVAWRAWLRTAEGLPRNTDAAAVSLKVSEALSKGMDWWSSNTAFCSSAGAANASGATNPPSRQA
jgi:hypothetical protein